MKIIKRVVILVISATLFLIRELKMGLLQLAGYESRRRCVFVYYHSLRAKDTAKFRWQMQTAKKNAVMIGAEVVGPLRENRLHVAVTSDDGYVSFISNGVPILRSMCIPCTIFVPTGNIGRGPMWQMAKNDPDRNEIVVDAVELPVLDRAGISIGSHGSSHCALAGIDDSIAANEILGSQATLRRILGRTVTAISLPYGEEDSHVIELCRKFGFTRVFSTTPKPSHLLKSEYVVGRVRVDPGDWRVEFFLKIMGAYSWKRKGSRARVVVKRDNDR